MFTTSGAHNKILFCLPALVSLSGCQICVLLTPSQPLINMVFFNFKVQLLFVFCHLNLGRILNHNESDKKKEKTTCHLNLGRILNHNESDKKKEKRTIISYKGKKMDIWISEPESCE